MIWKVFGRLTSTTISLGEESIVYTVGNRETVVPYEQITAIEIRSVRYVGGLFKIKSPMKTMKLAIAVNDIHRLIQLLKLELDSRGMASVYKPKKLFQFFKTSAFADESWARIYRIWWKLILFTIVTAVAGIAISILSDISGGVTVFFATLFPTIVYVITEFIFKLRISKLANLEEFSVPGPDIVYERKVYKKSMVWGSMVFIIWMLLLFISY